MKTAIFSLLFVLLNPVAHAQKRVALVIGNANYLAQTDLKNPVNDARLMKTTFEELGFTVHYHEDTTSDQMLATVHNFHSALTPGCTTAVFFFGPRCPGR